MSRKHEGGAQFHGEFSSADASAPADDAAARVSLFGAGSASALTLATTDQVVVTDMAIETSAALTVTVFDGANEAAGAGEIIYKGDVGTTSAYAPPFTCPFYCQLGTYPHVLTSGAGQVDVQMRGYIIRPGVL